MKKYIRTATSNGTYRFNIVVEIEYTHPADVAAATYTKDNRTFELSDGELLPKEKDSIISSQAGEDYKAFIESVIELLEDYYDLDIYYKNNSEDYSWYFGMIAKDANGSIIFDFDFTLRVSNHTAHRSKQSQTHKKERKAALKELTGGKKTKPIVKSILVNKDEFKTYLEAYQEIDRQVEEVVEIMHRSGE